MLANEADSPSDDRKQRRLISYWIKRAQQEGDGSAGSQDEWKMRKGSEREKERERQREKKKVLSRVTTKDFLNLV